MIRAYPNTSELVDLEERLAVVDNFGKKMLNSGHSLEEARRNLISGLKGYERKLKKSQTPGGPKKNKSAEDSSDSRRLKKLTGKSN